MPLPRSTPEAQGISSAAILNWIEAVEKEIKELHSFMLVRYGQVVAEGWWNPYKPDYPHMLFSLSKSYTSTAVGMAVAEKCFSIEDPVTKFFPDDLPAQVSPNLAAMKVKHLLAMCTGHAEDTTQYLHQAADGNWPKAFLARPVEYAPGTHFLYNTGATYMLSAIVQKTTGKKLIDYLTPRLFEPLGIENPTWEEDPRGVNTGGYGLSIRTEDIAVFGQLYLQKGEWQGKRLLSEDWVTAATSWQVDNSANIPIDWKQGYGYQFWRCRHNCYRGDGAFGQYCVVMPEQGAVLAITAGLGDMQLPLDLVWEHLLPAMKATQQPVDQHAVSALNALQAKMTHLESAVPKGRAVSPMAEQVAGKVFRLEEDPAHRQSARFDFNPDGCTLVITDPHGSHRVEIGAASWRLGGTTLFERPSSTAAYGAWSGNTYRATIRLYETPFVYSVSAKFTGDALKLVTQMNVGFDDPQPVTVIGKA